MDQQPTPPPRVCAVSYLNTSPLVWGLERTALGQQVRLSYELPSICADRVREGAADIGILPVIEIERQGLHYFPETGIACRGAVRSILLVSRVPLRQIRTLAGDAGSRTSVMLTRILLAERYGVEPVIVPMRADLNRMLDEADAALIIGDPALLLDPEALRREYEVLDLGEEWFTHTSGQSMIFALWAGPARHIQAPLGRVFEQSCRYGREHLEEIVAAECPARGIPMPLGHEYLTRYIVSELTANDHEGMQTYLRLARQFDTLKVSTSVLAV
jgi:predicted solute-binding protein